MTKQEKMYALIEAYRQSGRSAKMFCAEQGISLSTFQYWIQKQKKEQLSGFIPVKAGMQPSGTHPVELVYPNGIRLCLSSFNPQQISQLLNLRGCLVWVHGIAIYCTVSLVICARVLMV